MIRESTLAEIAHELGQAAYGQKSAIVGVWAERLGVARQTVWRALQWLKGRTRPKRADAGIGEADLGPIMTVAKIKVGTMPSNENRPNHGISTGLAIELAEANGLVPAGALTRRRVDRALRNMGFWATRHLVGRFQAEKSNALHIVDASGSKELAIHQMEDGAPPEEIIVGPREAGIHRTRKREPLSLWIVQVVDDHSRVAWGQYYPTTGETAGMMNEAICDAWSGNPRHDLRGMPEKLQCDHGPLRKADECKQMLGGLKIELVARNPNNPRPSGKLENRWRWIWQNFEQMFLVDRSMRLSLADLRERFREYIHQRNLEAHPWNVGQTRMQMYGDGMDGAEERYVPEDAWYRLYHHDVRHVGMDSMVRFRTAWYRVPATLADRWVEICVARDGSGAAVQHEGATYNAELMSAPPALDDWESRKGLVETSFERTAKEAREMRLQLPPVGMIPGALHLPTGRPAAMVTPLTQAAAAKRFGSRDEAIIEIGKRAGRATWQWPEAWRAALEAALTETMDIKRLTEFADVVGQNLPRESGLKLAEGG